MNYILVMNYFLDALISDFQLFASQPQLRFYHVELIIISLLALHVKDFISTCMNDFKNDHR